jgi:hypothetical protein
VSVNPSVKKKPRTIFFGPRNKKRFPLLEGEPDERNEARSARPANMSAEAGDRGIFTRTRKPMRVFLEPALAPETREATTFADLPQDIKNEILGRAELETADSARLRAVSHSMRDAVDASIENMRYADLAAILGCLTVLQNLLQRGHLDKTRVCQWAAWGGHLEMLKWTRENDCPWDEETCAGAAAHGHLEVLKWARENDCPWNEDTCAGAAAHGHLEVLKWARENGCPWDEKTCTEAAHQGHLEVLQWARENDCPWDEDACFAAAQGGHLEVLQWARENGCPWNSVVVCAHAIKGCHLEMVEWLRSMMFEEARD